MFPYAINARVRFQIALAECKDLKSMAAEKYLRGNIVDGVREFVNINEEAALVDLFRMHLVDDVEAFFVFSQKNAREIIPRAGCKSA